MKQENAIEVRDLKKNFKVYFDKGRELKEKLLFKNRNRYEERWVLKGISFEIKKGEAVGLIGQNGCGKSTTLKLLSKIIYPNSGSIEIKGRVSSLIELGAGFHADMSGRENIYTNASIFGLSKKEIDSRLDDIIAFSELEDYIDNPVRTYSSGMYMRLAFSVAINVNAEILLIDEILAVGDANFQAKCFNRLREIKAQGVTIVIVSHSLGQIEQICERTIWLEQGNIKREGAPRIVHPEYLDFMGGKRQVIADKEKARQDKLSDEQSDEVKAAKFEAIKKRWGNGDARINDVKLFNENNEEKSVFSTGKLVKIELTYEVNKVVKDAVFGIGIFRSDGINCYGTNTRIDKFREFDLEKSGKVSIYIDNLNLLPGEYTLDVAIECEVGVAVDYYKEAFRFEVFSSLEDAGVARLEHRWVI